MIMLINILKYCKKYPPSQSNNVYKFIRHKNLAAIGLYIYSFLLNS